ncbi:MAG: T9SS type A sorting domain-containing protein, partial [Crocinitomicaceae bacterium]|nr:T9SS type A sorting domain-containing protein [Crocinitomicaceae bacterium]
CADYSINRCWTAIDCSGNVTQYCQTITITDEGDGEGPWAPQVHSTTTERLVSHVNVYPNPTTDQTTFTVSAPESGRVVLDVFDLAGAKVSSVMNTRVEAGLEYKVGFDTGNLATGIYMYRLTNGSYSEMGRIVVNK